MNIYKVSGCNGDLPITSLVQTSLPVIRGFVCKPREVLWHVYLHEGQFTGSAAASAPQRVLTGRLSCCVADPIPCYLGSCHDSPQKLLVPHLYAH